jgi:hypothetical protein
MINKEVYEQLPELEANLLQAYHKAYGGNSSPFRQFKSFLLTGQRAKEGRVVVANFQAQPTEAGKQTGAEAWSATFAHRPIKTTAQQSQAAAPQPPDSEASQSGTAVVVGVDNELMSSDILKLSITAVTEKYTGEQLREYAGRVGATIADIMNSKQIIKAIAAKLKTDESKG